MSATPYATTLPVSSRQVAVATLAACMGWALDLFDLFVLLYVAPYVGRLFFPSAVPTLSLAAVYASFAVTLLMRPVGSALFGSYADRNGRKGAMVLAVTGVGISTAAFGLLPTIEQVGIVAPALFLVLRLVQGVFVGGVVASTHTIGTESVAPRWRGLMSGLVGGGGAGLGSLLASLVFLAASAAFPGDAFAVWGWRVMFFSGLVSSLLGWFVFRNLEESPLFQVAQERKRLTRAAAGPTEASPLRTLFSQRWRPVLLANLLVTTGGGAGYYLTSGYMPSFLKVVVGVPNGTASGILIGASLSAIAASLIVGHLSQMIGRRATFLGVGTAMTVLMPTLYLLMARPGAGLGVVTTCAFGLAFLGNAGYAPVLIFLNERFPTALRASGTGLSWNIGFAIGGTLPTFVSLASPTTAALPMSLAIFTAAVSLLLILGAVVTPETRGELL